MHRNIFSDLQFRTHSIQEYADKIQIKFLKYLEKIANNCSDLERLIYTRIDPELNNISLSTGQIIFLDSCHIGHINKSDCI